MAIQPIDLSTIYSQMDKVGQLNAVQSQLAHAANRSKLEQAAHADLEKSQSVQETARSQVESGKIKSDTSGGGTGGSFAGGELGKGREKNSAKEEDALPEPYQIRDPRLGQRIDVTG